MPLAPGTVVGRYEVRSMLGEGGMGQVYRAHDASLGRDVALKVLDTSVASDPERVHRFLQEARAASALNHPNIIAIHETGEAAGVKFIATELVDGRTVRDMLQNGPLPTLEALGIAAQTASALAAAHAAGIVHRDVKPENIMVRPDGYVKVLDFGLAKLSDPSASGAHPSPDMAATMLKTTAGMIMGTVAYMSPEQARALKVDVRTDCYSLGAVMFEMLTGRQPFTGATGTDVMVAILERDAPLDLLKKEGLPPQLVWVLAKALEKNPDLRHQSAADLRVDLERLKQDVATGAVYADQSFSADRPSAMLRDVSDSDADAIAMFRPSAWLAVAAAIGLAALIAAPMLYRRSVNAEQRAGLAEAAAEIRARDIAAALGHPMDGRNASAAFDDSELHLEAARDISPDEARRAVREGHAAQWNVNFNARASDQQPGSATVALTPDGRLRSFRIEPRTGRPQTSLTVEQGIAKAADAARQHLGVDVTKMGAPAHAWKSGDGTLIDIEWKNPQKFFGHDESVTAALDDSGFISLSRRHAYKEPETPGWRKRANEVRGAAMVFSIALAYIFGVVVLVRTKRWSLVSRHVPLALAACLIAGFGALAGDDEGSLISVVALLAVGLLVASGALPGFAGFYAWLKQSSAVRMHGAEQLASGHFRSPAAAGSVAAGLVGGAVLVAIMFAERAIALDLPGYSPSVSRELAIARGGFYLAPGAWLAAAAGLAVAVAFLYELAHRIFKHGKPFAAVLGLLLGVVTSSGDPIWLSASSTALCAFVLMAVYAMRGFGALFVSVVVAALLVDLVTARSVGGAIAGTRATALGFTLAALIGYAAWASFASRGRSKTQDPRSKVSSKLGI